MTLRPFWSYFGSKYSIAGLYPAPRHGVIIEPFAGSAGYALKYPHHQVILVERNPIIAEIWRYLTRARASEVRRIPLCEHEEDIPSWVSEGAYWLVRFQFNKANVRACRNISAAERRAKEKDGLPRGWNEKRRERVASQVEAIRHWKIIEGDYRQSPNIEATWFVDPPYFDKGSAYDYGSTLIDYPALGSWCRTRRGQMIACENEGAKWLPFRTLTTVGSNINRSAGSHEAVWTNDWSTFKLPRAA